TRENGSGQGGQFRVPFGSWLVIADVDWQYETTASPPGTMQIFRLFVVPLASTGPTDPGLRVGARAAQFRWGERRDDGRLRCVVGCPDWRRCISGPRRPPGRASSTRSFEGI